MYKNNWSESNGIMSIISTSNSREPDVLSYDIDSNLRTIGLGAKTTHEFLMQLEKEFSKMIDSVEKYEGFYIGRYETGNLGEEQVVVQKGNDDIGSQAWYTMYKKCKELEQENTNVKTGLIWGNQFDRTLVWLIESEAMTKEKVTDDSTSWGNYSNATFQYTNSNGVTATKNENSSTRIPTGSTEYTKTNNIYDLAGNVYDWTIEAYGTKGRVKRGGDFRSLGYASASYRYTSNSDSYPTYRNDNLGCRATLYIK